MSEFYPILVEDGHIWGRTSPTGDYIVCRKCGVVMKKNGKNAPCGGIVKVFPRLHKHETEPAESGVCADGLTGKGELP